MTGDNSIYLFQKNWRVYQNFRFIQEILITKQNLLIPPGLIFPIPLTKFHQSFFFSLFSHIKSDLLQYKADGKWHIQFGWTRKIRPAITSPEDVKTSKTLVAIRQSIRIEDIGKAIRWRWPWGARAGIIARFQFPVRLLQ